MLLIDHRDSFVHNVEQILQELGAPVVTLRSNEISLRAVDRMRPSAIVLSPGPGNPYTQRDRFRISIEIVKRFHKKIPILGICLGLQIINVAMGGTLRRAKRIYHGIVDEVMKTKDSPIFFGVPERFEGTRYHSLVIDELGRGLKVTALSLSDGEIMAIEGENLYGVQFHPESVGSLPLGKKILMNFLNLSIKI
ncbi:anthranilate synthase subunit II [Ignicoccus pacificus DSM 13166]|uniref:Anthranilate synthase subunit II n=1 Tax=Ignicoccus pacificus DSM 13166 TaxID=940294 RepID=A0A977PJF1_9CREN|nr:anthranilate synthase subunit II [Ignicoccus pacificus DSM 13166]